MKRLLDILGALVALALLAPVLALAALAVWLDDGGPVLFRQLRVGRGGREFGMFKFRTMVRNAAAIGPWHTADNDPRITRTGRFLRRSSIDELPQIINVLRGEMSLVGPRPQEPRVFAYYPEQQRRLVLRPGMTGPMQVSGRANLTMDERARLELDYIDHYSLWRDASILLRTIPVVLRGEGAQ